MTRAMYREIGCAFTALLAAAIAGCAVGPDYVRPETTTPDSWRIDYPKAAEVANTKWWEQFGDPVLNELIETALRENHDVRIAAARVDQFIGALATTRSQFFPQLVYGADASTNQLSREGQPAVPSPANREFDLYQAAVSASWQVDLFGRVRRLSEAAQARVYASEQAKRGVVLTLVTGVATSYITLRGLDRQREIAESTARNFGESLRVFDLRFKAGIVSMTEVSQVQSQHKQALAAIPAIDQQIAVVENLISVLLGRNPAAIPRGKSIDEFVAPAIPADLPSDLLQRRPDILQAEQNLVAANANIGATRALYFPTISLTGLFGAVSTDSGNFLEGSASAWSLGANLAGPDLYGRRHPGPGAVGRGAIRAGAAFVPAGHPECLPRNQQCARRLADPDRGIRPADGARRGAARIRPAVATQVRQGRSRLPRSAGRRERAIRGRARLRTHPGGPLHAGRERLPGHGRRLGGCRGVDDRHPMMQLFEAVALALVVLLPLANPLTTVALFIGLAGGMTPAERRRQSLLTAVYVFAILMVAYYGGQAVMGTFGISIPGLRIGGGLIVSSIGFSMLFHKNSLDDTPEVDEKSAELKRRAAKDIAFVPLAMPTTAGPGTIAMVITIASSIDSYTRFEPWVLKVAPVLVAIAIGVIVWLCLRSSDLVMRFFGRSGIEAISRLMGFLLVCMGVQFVINGILEIIRTLA